MQLSRRDFLMGTSLILLNPSRALAWNPFSKKDWSYTEYSADKDLGDFIYDLLDEDKIQRQPFIISKRTEKVYVFEISGENCNKTLQEIMGFVEDNFSDNGAWYMERMGKGFRTFSKYIEKESYDDIQRFFSQYCKTNNL